MRTLGERVERLEDILEVTETKPDVALLESRNSTTTTREDEVLKAKEPIQEKVSRQPNSEENTAPSGDIEETVALTSGKLKLKIKTEGGKRTSKVVSEDKENIDLTANKEVLSNGGEAKGHTGEKVKVDSVVLTPLSTSERAIDALRRQQNRTPSYTTNSEAGSGTFKDETELNSVNSEVGCDLFSEPEETEQSDIVCPGEKVEEEAVPEENLLPQNDIVPSIDIPADVEIPKKKEYKKKLDMKKKSLDLGPMSKRKSVRSQNISSESEESGLTNGHLEDETVNTHCSTLEATSIDPYSFQDAEPPDPDEFPDPDRSTWIKDNEKFSRCFRFKCPYCTFTDRTRHVVDDHIIIEHSIQGTSKMVPKYGEATKQQMLLLIERDPQLFTKYHEDLLFCEAPMNILEEVERVNFNPTVRVLDQEGKEAEVSKSKSYFSNLLCSCFKEECKFEREESRSEEMHRRSRELSKKQIEMAASKKQAEMAKNNQQMEMARKETAPDPRSDSPFQPAEDEEDTSCNESFNGSDVLTDETAKDWTPCDATLPPGWQFKEVRLQNGSLRKSYLSPCGKRLGGRDTVAEFLLCQGLDILHPTGFSETCCLPGLILISS